jgi:hypothetical protein
MNANILASSDPATVSQVIHYAVMIVGGMLALILTMMGSLWSQNKKQNDTVLAHLQKQADAIAANLDSCRAKDDASHKDFYVSIEALRDTISRAKGRQSVLEVRVGHLEEKLES